MLGTFVLELWKALEPSEHRAVLKFLDSPFHNQRADVRSLAALLADTPIAELNHLHKETVYEVVFPGEAYDNLRFNYTCSFLAQRIEAYFTWQEMDSNGQWRDWLLEKVGV